MAIVCSRCLGDSLAIRNLRLHEFDGEFVVVLYTPFEGAEVEFTLTLDNHLLKLFALFPDPCRILLMHTGEDYRKLLGIRLGYRFHGTGILGCRILDEVEFIFAAFLVQSVACVHIFQLHGSTYVTGFQFIGSLTDLSANGVNLCQTLFGALTGNILHVIAGMQGAAHYLEVAYFADVRFYGSLEHEDAQRAVGFWFYLLAVDCFGRRHIGYERTYIAQELHHTANAHILDSADDEYGIDAAVDETFADTFAHFVFAQGAFLEILVHEGFVILGCCLKQHSMEFFSLIHLVSGDVADGRFATIGTPFQFLHQKNVNHGIETGAGLQRVLQGYHFGTEYLAHLFHDVVIVSLFAVNLVESENNRFLQLFRYTEYVACAYFHAIFSVENYYAGIAHSEGSVGIAYKIICSRAVYYVQFLT